MCQGVGSVSSSLREQWLEQGCKMTSWPLMTHRMKWFERFTSTLLKKKDSKTESDVFSLLGKPQGSLNYLFVFLYYKRLLIYIFLGE